MVIGNLEVHEAFSDKSESKARSLQQYAEIRRNAQAKTPSKDFLRIGFQRSQKHADGYTQRHFIYQGHLTEPQGTIKR